MPRKVLFIAVGAAILSAFALTGPAGADHVAGDEPYFSCRASVARTTLTTGSPIPTIEPLIANANREECAEDSAGAPTIALPPSPDPSPVVSAGLVQASTEILCADDDPDPLVDPTDNDECDAGRPSFEQQTLSKADAANVRLLVGGLDIRATVANTSARASCDEATNVPLLTSTSRVLDLTIDGVPTPIPTGDEPFTLNLGIVKLVLNERIGTEGLYADDAPSGEITRRAIHASVSDGSVADVVVAESTADFHGDVCPEGKIVVKKETAPDENPKTTNFDFTSPGLTPSVFSLKDDGTQTFDEVQPATYSIGENAPTTGGYTLTAINCAENRTDNTTTALTNRTAAVNVGPGETVTCTFINAKPPENLCPPNTTPNGQGQCIITAINCPAGSTLNGQGQCIINAATCPAGSTRLDPNGPCVVNNPNCPAGSSKNPQGQCVVTNVQCPTGTVFNPTTLGCAEGPRGGTVFPINGQVKKLFAGSPCVGRGFGPLNGIFGTNGNDRITGTNTSDRIFAFAGNDRVSGGRGDDCVEGGAGNDVVDGSNGNDFLLGGSGRDRMEGGPGNDRFSGGSGKDVLSGGQGNDRFSGGRGNDRMNGGFGNDVIRGGPGNDGISNGNGKDRVYGGAGNDTINVAIVGPKAFVDCGPGKKDRVRISPGKARDITRNCEFFYIAKRTRNGGRGNR